MAEILRKLDIEQQRGKKVTLTYEKNCVKK